MLFVRSVSSGAQPWKRYEETEKINQEICRWKVKQTPQSLKRARSPRDKEAGLILLLVQLVTYFTLVSVVLLAG